MMYKKTYVIFPSIDARLGDRKEDPVVFSRKEQPCDNNQIMEVSYNGTSGKLYYFCGSEVSKKRKTASEKFWEFLSS